MTAYGVSLAEQVTFLLGRHDLEGIFEGSPDAPPDEYESEAEAILANLPPRLHSVDHVIAVVKRAFDRSFDGDPRSGEALRRAARDIYMVVQGAREDEHGA